MTSSYGNSNYGGLESIQFQENSDPRCACVLVLDVSSSMRGAPIDQLNQGLQIFAQGLQEDNLARRRVEVAIVTFGNQGVQTVQDFVTAQSFFPPTLSTGQGSPMGAAITQALDLIAVRKTTYNDNGIQYYRPWIFLITDGEPSDQWQAAAARVHQEEAAKSVAFFAVGVDKANMSVLQQISTRTPLHLNGLNFRSMFQWLSRSMGRVSGSKVGTEVALESPAGWATV